VNESIDARRQKLAAWVAKHKQRARHDVLLANAWGQVFQIMKRSPANDQAALAYAENVVRKYGEIA
jgi:hypothetical protein